MPNDMNRAVRSLPAWAVVAVWLAILLALVPDVVVPLGSSGRFINLSAFDAVVPICLLAVWCVRPLHHPPYKILAGLGVAAVLAVTHSAITFVWAEDIQLAGLARETAKLVAVCLLIAALSMLFRAPELRQPPAWVFAVAIAVLAAKGLYHRFYELTATTPYLETLDANNIVGVAILWVAVLVGRDRSAIGGAGFAVFIPAVVLTILLGSKTFLLVSVAVLVLFATAWVAPRRPAKGLAQLLLLGGALSIGGAVAYGISELTLPGSVFFEQSNPWVTGWRRGPEPESIPTFRSLGDSMSIRLALWDYATELTKASFPWGVGLGQFGALSARSPALAEIGLRFVHNTPLALVTELGALGLAGVAGLAYLGYLACRGWSVSVMAAFALYLVVPMMLHDALGMRMTLLVIAYGIAQGLERWRPG